MEKIQIVYKKIGDLKPYKKNAKKHSKEQVEQRLLYRHEEEQKIKGE